MCMVRPNQLTIRIQNHTRREKKSKHYSVLDLRYRTYVCAYDLVSTESRPASTLIHSVTASCVYVRKGTRGETVSTFWMPSRTGDETRKKKEHHARSRPGRRA
jgi:hypothetical protein